MISQNIRSLRERNGLTQEGIADRLGVARQTVAKWESGEATPDLDRCADHIIYIDNGVLIGSGETAAFRDTYRVMPLDEARARGANILGVRRSLEGDTALVPASNGWGSPASLDDIMSHTRNGFSEEVV